MIDTMFIAARATDSPKYIADSLSDKLAGMDKKIRDHPRLDLLSYYHYPPRSRF